MVNSYFILIILFPDVSHDKNFSTNAALLPTTPPNPTDISSCPL